MVRTQIQMPDQLFQRAKRFAEARETSLAELTRRGLELLLDRWPEQPIPALQTPWALPTFDSGGMRVPLEQLRDIAADEESLRGLG